MTDKVIFAMFPGQGSQYIGMGRSLYDNSPAAKEVFDQSDSALGDKLSSLIFEGNENDLRLTHNSQPAILTVSIASYRAFLERYPEIKGSITAAAGHSLGEYSALTAANAIDLNASVPLVRKRGEYMQNAVPVGEGKMVAVLGKTIDEVRNVCLQVSAGVCEVANINLPSQIVVAGDTTGVEQFIDLLDGGRVKELNVSAPFHCSLMKSAAEKLCHDLNEIEIRRPEFPIYSNVTADVVVQPEEIRHNLAQQVCGTVRWSESIENFLSTLPSHESALFIEFGPNTVLTGLLKKINRACKVISIGSIDDLIKVEKILEKEFEQINMA